MSIILNGTTGITTPAETATTSVTTPIVTSPSATALTIQSAGTTAMTVDTSQNVGIGTSSPSSRFAVNGGTSTSQIRWEVNNAAFTQEVSTNAAANAYVYKSNDASYHVWKVSSTEQMRIDTSGNLLVGTTGPVNLEKFNVTGSPANLISRFYNANASNPNGVGVFYSALSPNGSSNAFFYAADSTALRFNVQSNGGIANYSANNTNLSDERLKKDVQLAGSYLDKICAIPVKTFLYNDQTDSDLNLGVIAQDVDAIAPELVCRDGWKDKDGEPTDYLTIYQTDLQYALMKCIQELSAKNDALEAANTAFEARLAALEAK
jgi:hypothetical protein